MSILLLEVLHCCVTVNVTGITANLLYSERDQNEAFKEPVLSPSE